MKKGKSFTLTEETLKEISRLEKIHGLNSSSLLDRIFLEIKLTGKYTAPVADIAHKEDVAETKEKSSEDNNPSEEVATEQLDKDDNSNNQESDKQEKEEEATKCTVEEKEESKEKITSARKKILQKYK